MWRMVQSVTTGKPSRKIEHFEKDSFYLEYLLPMYYFAIIAHLCAMFVGSKVVREKMVIIKNLGVQIESYSMRGSCNKRFIDISRVRDIVINEVRICRGMYLRGL